MLILKCWQTNINNKQKLLLHTLVLFFVVILFNGCKKGEDDPFFSLRTRKARVEGDWKLQKGNLEINTVDANGNLVFNQLWSIANNRFAVHETTKKGITNAEGDFILKLSCSDEGAVVLDETLGGRQLKADAYWDFSGGIGDAKKKGGLVFRIKSVSVGETSGYFLFNQSSIEFNYAIKELRNTTMVLTVSSQNYIDSQGITQKFTGEYTFTQ